MIQKQNLFYPTMASFLSKKISADAANTSYVTDSLDADPEQGEPDIMFSSVVFIADTRQIWTRGVLFGGDPSTTYVPHFRFEPRTGILYMTKVDGMPYDFRVDDNNVLRLRYEQ